MRHCMILLAFMLCGVSSPAIAGAFIRRSIDISADVRQKGKNVLAVLIHRDANSAQYTVRRVIPLQK